MMVVLVTLALLSSMPAWMLGFGLLFAWLAGAQTETVYLTQTQTIYTVCDCPSAILSPLSPLLSLSTSSTSVPDVVPDSTPGVVSGFTPGVVGSGPPSSETTVSLSSSKGISTALTTIGSLPVTTSTSQETSSTTSASVITLSDGLGPLLSSSSSTLTSSTPSSSEASTEDTVIGVLSDTMTPTAASSDLSTSGIPESLSVDLSRATTKPGLHSSTGLISFGTFSPAVLSTVLPPGASMGTSSKTVTTYATITLSSASLTGVTLLAPRSPTSCFTLPVPTASLDLIAVAVVPQNDYDLSNPILLAFGDNGTTPQYMSAMARGNPYVLDLSPNNDVTGQLGLQIPGENALVFDGSGMSLYTGNCSTLTQVLVDDFYSQLGSMAGRSTRGVAAPKVKKRQSAASSAFTVEVALDTYLDTPKFSPNLTFGDSQCTLQLNKMGSETNNISWSCTYPPPTGGVAACEASLDSWLNDMTAPSTTPRNTTAVLATVSPFLALAGDSILDLFPGSDSALALAFTFMRQAEKAAKQAVGHVGPAACEVMHAFDSDDLVVEDSGPLGTQTLGSYMTAPPPSLAINLAAAATAAIVNIPRRKVNPKDNFLKQIATEFKSIFGAFTHWLGGFGWGHKATTTSASSSGAPGLGIPGLGGIGGGGFEEAGALPVANPIVTITSTSTLETPSIVHISLPTVTVTHVLGNGWFTPSTYAVNPETSVVPQIPPQAPADAITNISVTDTASFTIEEYHFLDPSSTPTYAPSNLVEHVVDKLESMELSDANAHTGGEDSPRPPNSETGTTTHGAAHGYEGHVVVVTTTVTFFGSSSPE